MRPAVTAASFAVLATFVVVYLARPDGIGGLAFVAVAALGLLSLAIGPTVRRARPRGAWRYMTAAGVFFLVGLALRLGLLPAGGTLLTTPDLWTVIGYLLVLRSLAGLLAHAAKGSGRLAALDATIVTSGAALGFFSAELGPHLGLARREDLATIALNILYPVLDAALLAFTVHLAFRTSRRSPAMALLLAGMTSWMVADIGYLVLWHFRPASTSPWLNAIFMLTYALIGAAGSHPSVRQLASPAVGHAGSRRECPVRPAAHPAGPGRDGDRHPRVRVARRRRARDPLRHRADRRLPADDAHRRRPAGGGGAGAAPGPARPADRPAQPCGIPCRPP